MFSHRIHGIHRTDWQRVSSHRFHRFTQMLCFWSSVNSVYSVGLPTPPVNLCKSVQSVGGLFWLRGVYPPTKQTGRDVLPQNSRNSQNRLAEDVLPQNSRNSQNRLAEDVLPQISQIYTDGACLEFCEFCVFCGTSHAPSESVKICAICGRIVLVAWGLPSYRIDWQRRSPTEFSEFTEVSLACSSHGIHRIHRSFACVFFPQNSQNSQMVCVWSSVNSVDSVGPSTPPVDL